MNSQDFVQIFYSNYQVNIDWQNIDEINWMYGEGLFTLDKINVATNQQFQLKIDFVSNPLNGFIKTGESIAHMALKSICTDYLCHSLKVPLAEILYESPFLGFEVDVIDKTRQFPCECGDTNALKLEKYLSSPTTKGFLILPYPHQNDVFVYLFQPSPRFYEYIDHKKNYHSQRMHKLRK